MIWLLGAALAADCPPPAGPYLVDVAERGDEDAYLCLITTDTFREPLVDAIVGAPADDPARPRYTRALALHLAARADEAWDPALVRLLSPADRRLLADAVKARRGRKSPSAEHDAIFAKQPWYRADRAYSDNELTDLDRANIALANDPPVPAPEPVAPLEAPAATEAPPSACGCSATRAPVPLWIVLLGVLAGRRRAQLHGRSSHPCPNGT